MDHLKILMDLIAIDNTVPPGKNYEQTIDYLEPLFKLFGCETQKIHIPKEFAAGEEGRLNLIAHRRNPGKRRLIFYTHIDVVPVQGWDGFNPRVVAGKVYGRGAADMKGALVSLLIALERLKGKMTNYDVSCLVTVDEETGHGFGDELRYVRSFLEPVSGADFFSLDGPNVVQVADLGVYAADITVHGKSVHQGGAFLGENAVENAIRLCQPLIKLGEEVIQKRSQVPCDPNFGLTYLQPNLTITMIHGGIKVNVVPDECVISLARRVLPEENIETVEKEILSVLNSVPGVRWDLKRTMFLRPFPPTLDEPEADKLAQIVEQVTGIKGKYGAMGSVPLDPIGFEWKAKIFGVGIIKPENNPHGIDEFIEIKEVEKLAEIIERFLIS